MYKKKLGQTYYTNRHSCFLLQYHIVLVTKYRRPVLTGAVKELVYQVIQDIFDEKDLVILEMNGESDHIHILFEADPFTAPGTLVNVIKTKTSRYARKQYGDTFLKEYYWVQNHMINPPFLYVVKVDLSRFHHSLFCRCIRIQS